MAGTAKIVPVDLDGGETVITNTESSDGTLDAEVPQRPDPKPDIKRVSTTNYEEENVNRAIEMLNKSKHKTSKWQVVRNDAEKRAVVKSINRNMSVKEQEEKVLKQFSTNIQSTPFPWIIHPEKQALLAGMLDLMIGLALVFTALVTPFEVAFLPSAETMDVLFITNRIVDIIFCIDVLINFCLMYQHSSTIGISADSKWEHRQLKICKRYLTSWFLLDVGSLVPSVFDILPFLMPGQNTDYGPVKVVRVIKILKLVKLVRLLRGSRIIARWQTKFAISYANLTLGGVFVQIVLTTHIFACLFSLQTIFSDEERLDTWMQTFGYCACVCEDEGGSGLGAAPGLPSGAVGVPSGIESASVCREVGCSVETVDHWNLYSACFFWALGAVTGYGAVPEVGPFPPPSAVAALSQRFSLHEKLVLMAVLAVGALLWVFVTAKFVDVISNANPDVTAFRYTMDCLNRFIAFNGLPPELAQRLREYYYATAQMQAANTHKSVTSGMSPALQEEVSLKLNARWLRDVAFFNGLQMLADDPSKPKIRLVDPVEDGFLAQVAMKLHAAVYAPKEKPPRGSLYLIYGGAASYKGRILGVGKTFGEIDVMLPLAPRQYRATALAYLHVFYLTGPELETVALEWPKSRKAMKTWAIYNGLKEYLLHNLSEERKKAREDPEYDMYAVQPEAGMATQEATPVQKKAVQPVVGTLRAMEVAVFGARAAAVQGAVQGLLPRIEALEGQLDLIAAGGSLAYRVEQLRLRAAEMGLDELMSSEGG